MLQDKQVDRMVQKVARLEQMYGEFLVKYIVAPKVTTVHNGKEIEVQNGYRWGKAFKCQSFSFVVENINENEKHYVFANSGAAEHLISVNGEKPEKKMKKMPTGSVIRFLSRLMAHEVRRRHPES